MSNQTVRTTQDDSAFTWNDATQSMQPTATLVKLTEEEAKAKLAEAKRLLAIAQGKTPGKKGRTKLYNYERVIVSAMVSKEKIDQAKSLLPDDAKITDLVNLAIDAFLEKNTVSVEA